MLVNYRTKKYINYIPLHISSTYSLSFLRYICRFILKVYYIVKLYNCSVNDSICIEFGCKNVIVLWELIVCDEDLWY